MDDLVDAAGLPGTQSVSGTVHGGPDARGAARYDFSTNSNACGPCPATLTAVQQADATRYPDPAYTALRARLAALHGVTPDRIVLAASASEFIHRITALAAQQGVRFVALPAHSYGDYAQAAQARGLQVLRPAEAGWSAAGLHWACEPSSPLGRADPALTSWRNAGLPAALGKGWGGGQQRWNQHSVAAVKNQPEPLRVLDCAYRPLRLHTGCAWGLPDSGPAAWQLWTPNKALGLTGVRAAYAIAPPDAEVAIAALTALAPSWPVGAHGVALLASWVQPATQRWLADCLPVLRDWKAQQQVLCNDLGWTVLPDSQANYFCAQMHSPDGPSALLHLRRHGIQLRDCSSFGLPGHVRLGVLPPAAQSALRRAWLQR